MRLERRCPCHYRDKRKDDHNGSSGTDHGKLEESAFVVGNIGNPYTSIVPETKEDSVIVAEMSSFQLETVHTFRPRVSAILNITPDHLNRHHTMEAYIAAKERIAENQTADDVCVLNYEDDVLREFGEKVAADVLYFSSRRKLKRGVYLDGTTIVCNVDKEIPVCDVSELQILGTHNHENAMAAAAMAYAYGTPVEVIKEDFERICRGRTPDRVRGREKRGRLLQ